MFFLGSVKFDVIAIGCIEMPKVLNGNLVYIFLKKEGVFLTNLLNR